jgi:AcrR family transcriptional regulator
MSLNVEPPTRRRRGAELESALLDAVWAELVEKDYDALTYEAVAERASTSRAVVYRRWPTKPELVRAAVSRAAKAERIEPIDTGTLRDDLIELLEAGNRERVRTGIILTTRLGGYFQETGTALGDLREVFLQNHPGASRSDLIYDRAVARGEVRPERLTPRARTLAFDLFRSELLMTLKPVPKETIEAIVDEVVVPLLTR